MTEKLITAYKLKYKNILSIIIQCKISLKIIMINLLSN